MAPNLNQKFFEPYHIKDMSEFLHSLSNDEFKCINDIIEFVDIGINIDDNDRKMMKDLINNLRNIDYDNKQYSEFYSNNHDKLNLCYSMLQYILHHANLQPQKTIQSAFDNFITDQYSKKRDINNEFLNVNDRFVYRSIGDIIKNSKIYNNVYNSSNLAKEKDYSNNVMERNKKKYMVKNNQQIKISYESIVEHIANKIEEKASFPNDMDKLKLTDIMKTLRIDAQAYKPKNHQIIEHSNPIIDISKKELPYHQMISNNILNNRKTKER